MSCFIMKQDAISKLAGYIEGLLNMGFNYFGMEAPTELYTALSDCVDNARFYSDSKIFSRLYALNMAAYTGRYNRESVAITIPEYKAIKAYNRPTYNAGHYQIEKWMIETEKRLACFLYQCDENPANKSELFIALRELDRRLNAFIVHNMAAWHSGRWGE